MRKNEYAAIEWRRIILTFIDDHTRYTWIYVMKRKDQVFDRFREWKAPVEKSTGNKLKVLRTDNGGAYTSTNISSQKECAMS